MKVADFLEARRENWRELENLCGKLERNKSRVEPQAMLSFSSLYRAACADLALADAYQLPQNTVAYLHHLVGRAHNQLYPSRRFNYKGWWEELFVHVPRRLVRDPCMWLAAGLFWGFFISCMVLAYIDHDFALTMATEEELSGVETMHADSIGSRGSKALDLGNLSASFYIRHNTSIGIECFAWGLIFGVGGMFATLSNACKLGTYFGYVARTDSWANFFHFVTAHGPFELTAIVLAAGAGMRLGFSLVNTQGWTREASLLRAARQAVPAMGLSMIFFFFAALLEGFLSPSAPPDWWPFTPQLDSWYWFVKFPISMLSILMMIYYFFVLGFSREIRNAT